MTLKLALLAALLLAPPALVVSPPGFLTPAQLRQALSQRKQAHQNFVLINVHVPYQGQITGTDLSLPFDTIGRSRQLPADRRAKIVLYCRSGSMSAVARQTLNTLGYTNVRELQGGFNAWKAAGYELNY